MRKKRELKKCSLKGLLLSGLLAAFFLCSAFTYQEEKQRIYDNADLLTDAEEMELEDIYKEYSL
ncbi:MAG: hypothetical protein Q4B70_12650 [Lachnospiraceae bacterium]|nr:hypothetical protein [Lachnospiraceae bacterium]